MSDWNVKIIEEFRANRGTVGGMFEGATLVLLTTVGARSGERRTNPVTYLRDGGRILVFASNAGAEAHPAWYHNLLAHPQVTVEIGDGTAIETYPATAHPLRGQERDALYARQAAISPAFADYQAGTTRVIPVVALYRDDPGRARALGEELVRIHRGLREELAALLASVDEATESRSPTAGASPDLGAAARPPGPGAAGVPPGPGAAAARPGLGRPGARPGLGAQLRERCLAFCATVHAHHTSETERGFPLLHDRYPGLTPVLERLRREHEVLAGLRERFEETLAAAAGADDPARIQAELHRLAAEMEAHFDREERQLVPALNAL